MHSTYNNTKVCNNKDKNTNIAATETEIPAELPSKLQEGAAKRAFLLMMQL